MKTLPLLAAALLASNALAQQHDPLLDLLVKKKVLTEKEADSLRGEMAEQNAQSAAGKLKLSKSLTELRISGDLRERYQYDTRDFQVGPDGTTDSDFGSGSQRSRWIFRLRLRADFKLTDNWFGGVELSTSPASDSGNATYGDSRGGAGFSKYDIFISKAFLGWENDWLTLVYGKQANPFYNNELFWDPDINPDGLSEVVRLDKLLTTPPPNWSLSLNLGQFIFADNIENGGKTSEPGFNDNDVSDDAYLFGIQLQGTYKFKNKNQLVFAPTLYFYNAASVFGAVNTSHFSDTASLDSSDTDRSFIGETRDMLFLNTPGELGFKLAKRPARFYWDLSYNFMGKSRVQEIYGVDSHSSVDDFAYLVGFQLGENKKAGDLSFNVNYRQIGLAGLDPNLNESDWALSQLNVHGPKFTVAYSLTDFAWVAVSYSHAWNLRDDLSGGEATSGADLANTNSVDVFQVDMNLKF